jgi:glycosyltransferase involved in cell wall biosynthesis
MKVLWLIPINVSKSQAAISEKNYMVSEKNEIGRSIKDNGNEICAVFSYNHQYQEMDGFSKVEYFHLKRPQFLFKLIYHLKLLNSVIKGQDDVILFGIHSSHLIPLTKIISSTKKTSPLLILDIRSVPVDLTNNLDSKFKLIRYNFSVKLADLFCHGITCITPMLGTTLKPKLRKLKKKVGYFQTGVNFEIFNPKKSSSLRLSLGLNNKFIILYHGVLSINRGLQNVIKAMEICKKLIPNILFLIVGSGHGEAELRNLTKKMELEKYVLFAGSVSFNKVPNYIKTADAGIIPLPKIEWWNVSSPIKLKEYLAMQLPVIATDIPAHRLVVEKTGGAILTKNHEPGCLAEAILSFYKYRKTTYEIKSREQLFKIISYSSQAIEFNKFIEQISFPCKKLHV